MIEGMKSGQLSECCNKLIEYTYGNLLVCSACKELHYRMRIPFHTDDLNEGLENIREFQKKKEENVRFLVEWNNKRNIKRFKRK